MEKPNYRLDFVKKSAVVSRRIIFLSLFIVCVCSSYIIFGSPRDSPLLPEGAPSKGEAMHLCIHLPSGICEPDFDTEFGGAMIKTGLDYLCSVSTGPVDGNVKVGVRVTVGSGV